MEMTTTIRRGKNMVGLPSETEMAGISWRKPTMRKYTIYE
jgi:hypothetical protein